MDWSSMSPPGATVSARRQEREVLCGLLSMSYRPCQDFAPVWTLCGLQLPLGPIHLFWHGVFHGLQGRYLPQCGSPRAVGAQHESPWSSWQAAGESLLWHLEHLFPILFPVGVCRAVSFTFFFFFFSADHTELFGTSALPMTWNKIIVWYIWWNDINIDYFSAYIPNWWWYEAVKYSI